jgi:dihydrofolate synthase/folylpolyglutamate synthase
MDHVEFLGDTIEKIAAEKAGILKNGVPAVIAPQTQAALGVIERQAARVRAPLHASGQQWMTMAEHGRLVFQDEDGLLDLPAPRLFGRHQFDNAGTAIAALRASGLKLPGAAFEQGLVKADWPARLQRITSGRLVTLAPSGAEIWLDGGHNAEGGRASAVAMADLEERVSRPLVLIVGMLTTKDRAAFLGNFTGLARRVIGVPIAQEKTVPADEIADAARRVGLAAESHTSIEQALSAIARFNFDPSARILITGSLYLAGEVLALNGTVPV